MVRRRKIQVYDKIWHYLKVKYGVIFVRIKYFGIFIKIEFRILLFLASYGVDIYF